MSERAGEILRDQLRLQGERGVWESHCQQIAERCQPKLAGFTAMQVPGSRRTDKMFDSTAALASENFSAAMVALTAPREQRWHGLRSGVDDLDRVPAVARYFEAVTNALFYHRYSPRSNFNNQYQEIQMSLGLFGPGALWIDEDIARRSIIYRNVFVAELYFEEDEHGRVTTIYRRWRMSAANIERRWPDGNLHPNIREAIAQKHGHREFELIQCIRPRRDVDPRRMDARGMPIESIVTMANEPWVIYEGGYSSMPLNVARYTASPREPYGRSPAMQALPDIKMVNEMTRTLMRAAHKAVDPPLAVFDDGVLTRLNNQPGKVNVGGVNSDGRLLVQSLYSGGSIPIGREMLMDAREVINKAFLVPLFSVLSDTPDRMTATEVLERAKEKGILLSPAAGRIEAEVLGPMIEREIDLLARMGLLPPMPGELIEAEGEYRATYDNPLNRAAKSERSIGALRTLEALAPIAQIKPEVLDVFDWPALARMLAEDNAVPPSVLRDPAAIAQERENAEAQQQIMGLLQGAQMAGDAAQSLSVAQDEALVGGV